MILVDFSEANNNLKNDLKNCYLSIIKQYKLDGINIPNEKFI